MAKNLNAAQVMVRKEVLEALFNDCISMNVRYIKKLESMNIVVPDYDWPDRLTYDYRAFEGNIVHYIAKQTKAPATNNPTTTTTTLTTTATTTTTTTSRAAAALQAFQA